MIAKIKFWVRLGQIVYWIFRSVRGLSKHLEKSYVPIEYKNEELANLVNFIDVLCQIILSEVIVRLIIYFAMLLS